jgi:hypothetical protein
VRLTSLFGPLIDDNASRVRRLFLKTLFRPKVEHMIFMPFAIDKSKTNEIAMPQKTPMDIRGCGDRIENENISTNKVKIHNDW